MSQLISKKRGLVLAVALTLLAVPGAAYARDGETEEATETESSHVETVGDDNPAAKTERSGSDDRSGRQSVKEAVQTAKEEAGRRVEATKQRLENAQLKRCQAQEKAVTRIMARIAERGERQLTLFTTIAERVESFYTEKGKTTSNYDELVADVNTKKEAAQTTVSAIKSADTTFKCDGDNPRGVVDGFQASLKQEIVALKEYRTAVKNLISGVKSAQSAAAGEGAQQ